MTGDSPEQACAAFAAKNHGVITRRAAISCGMTPRMIGRRTAAGEWRILFPGAYFPAAVPVTWLGLVAGAVLAAGPESAASHRCAGRLLGLDGFEKQIVEISSSRQLRWHRVVTHKATELLPRDITRVKNIVTTNATRVLVEVGGLIDLAYLEAAIDSALIKGLTSIPHLERRLDDWAERGKSGVGPLRRLLASRAPGQAPTESELERRFSQNVIKRFDLPSTPLPVPT